MDAAAVVLDQRLAVAPLPGALAVAPPEVVALVLLAEVVAGRRQRALVAGVLWGGGGEESSSRTMTILDVGHPDGTLNCPTSATNRRKKKTQKNVTRT